ncbi:unnamed protein product [Angiostrongylus costaricensis]|uniref:Gelsolin-like domain-containing protein n=1 Tax=Angiostrongylus costaricensis TaxID=334426 RepID=A0A0R3PVH5_ANGCS|nr:unnamed protein product [Angiostrongylus costaricensis]
MRNTSEPFENVIAKTNLVLRVTDDYKLQSVAKGEHPRFGFLQPKETLIFDFGSEVYVWSGRSARKTSGRYAVEYAQQLMTKRVTSDSSLFGVEMNEGRAPWILYLRVFQGVQFAEDQVMTREMKNVVTENLEFWQLIGEELVLVERTNIFINNCCYVIRWQYRIQTSGRAKLFFL